MATRKLMRAVVVSGFGGPSVLQFQSDIPVPNPGVTQVLIRDHACGVNPVETHIRSGAYAGKSNLPYTPGTDVAGEVEAVGKHVKSFKAGDWVFTSGTVTGGYAEHTVASEEYVHPLPDNLNYKQGAAIGIPYFTAYRALFHNSRVYFNKQHRAHFKAGERVLIHEASSGVGVAACQIARAFGMKLLGIAGTCEGLNLALKNGAHQEATCGQGVNVIVEMLSNMNLNADLQLLSFGGRVITVGCRGPIEINPRDTMAKETSIIGMSLFSATKEERAASSALLFAGMKAGLLSPVIGPEYPLEQASPAHEDIISSSGALGKMVLIL